MLCFLRTVMVLILLTPINVELYSVEATFCNLANKINKRFKQSENTVDLKVSYKYLKEYTHSHKQLSSYAGNSCNFGNPGNLFMTNCTHMQQLKFNALERGRTNSICQHELSNVISCQMFGNICWLL